MLRRILELRKGAELAITSQLENKGEQSLPVRLRIHPEFAFAGGAGTRVETRTPGSQWRPVEGVGSGGEAFERYLQGDELPAGAWRIDSPGLGWRLTNRFPADQVEVCYINADAGQGRRNLPPEEFFAMAERAQIVPEK